MIPHVHGLDQRRYGPRCAPEREERRDQHADRQPAIVLHGDDHHLVGDEVERFRREFAHRLKLRAERDGVGENAPHHEGRGDGREDLKEGVK